MYELFITRNRLPSRFISCKAIIYDVGTGVQLRIFFVLDNKFAYLRVVPRDIVVFGRACANNFVELYRPGEFFTLPCIRLTGTILIVIFSKDLKVS